MTLSRLAMLSSRWISPSLISVALIFFWSTYAIPAGAFQPSPSNSLNPSRKSSNTYKLDYNAIQDLIDVSHPYYKLENERAIMTPATEKKNGVELFCTVKTEMPVGREVGLVSLAEAGRHMAIAGSVAAALNQPNKGKHYYLALDNRMIRVPYDTDIDDRMPKGTKSGETVILAWCTNLGKREAACEIIMKVPGEDEAWFLSLTYSVISEKVVDRFVPTGVVLKPHVNSPQAPAGIEYDSPYARFQGLPGPFEILKQSHELIILKSSLPKVPAHQCLGHFDGGKSALPVALLAGYCCDLVGKSIGTLSGVDIPFKNSLKDDQGSCMKVLQLEMKASKLVYAETQGLELFCKVVAQKDAAGEVIFYSVKVSVQSDLDKELIAMMEGDFLVTCTLNNARTAGDLGRYTAPLP